MALERSAFEYQGKLYNCKYADPPWSYENENTGGSVAKGTGNNSGAASKYLTMPTEDIASIPIHKIADTNCCLFMWGVTPFPEDIYDLLESFKVKIDSSCDMSFDHVIV